MNELVIEKQTIENLIFEIRGEQVMLDSDLAKLYECANGAKTINQAVKRNAQKFPERYCFQLTDEEYEKIKYISFNSKTENGYGGRRYNPRVLQNKALQCLLQYLKQMLLILSV